jgi:5-formyltetrahydrofolate cyclo-ligase
LVLETPQVEKDQRVHWLLTDEDLIHCGA